MTNDPLESYRRGVEERQKYLVEHTPTLRDLFAQAALGGLVSYHAINGLEDEMLARRAYEISDAMIKERVKGEAK